jgi:predicted 3-demethylubiquinone-9 3-methyltransferase (glyoxalase superfamily)
MPKIIPYLWYDKEAKEAALLYAGFFDNSGIDSVHIIDNSGVDSVDVGTDTPVGDAEALRFTLANQPFAAISAGPFFKFNPSASLMVAFDDPAEVDKVWNALLQGGEVMMALDAYPFSKRYGWLTDKYGLSWQLMVSDEERQKITPNLLFSGAANGKAEEALRFYAEVFPDSSVGLVSYYGEGEASAEKAKVNYAAVTLGGFTISAMDNAYDADFMFNEAFSFEVDCKDQQEIDYYWDKLSAVPEAEQCGWIKDKFGVSWQIVPVNLDALLFGGTDEENKKVSQALLKMKKLDIAALENARK